MFAKLLEKWFKLHDGIRYFLVGCSNTGIGYLLFVLFYFLLHNLLHYREILFVSYVFSLCFAYICMKYLVFRTKGKFKKELPKYLGTYFVLFLLNEVILTVTVEAFHLWPPIGQLISTVIVAALGYVANKFFSFRH